MTARAVDLTRPTPTPAARSPLSQTSRTAADLAAPKPPSRFDDELKSRTQPKHESAKADVTKNEPHAKAKPRHGDDDRVRKTDDASKPDAHDDTESAETDNATEAEVESTHTDRHDAKPVKKAAKKNASDEDAETDPDATAEATTTTGPVLPTQTVDTDADTDAIDAIDTDAASDADESAAESDDADATLDLAQAAAQTAAPVTPVATDETATKPAETATHGTTGKATAAVSATTATPGGGEPAEGVVQHAHAAKGNHGLKATETDTASAEAAGKFALPPEAEKAAETHAHKDDAAAIPVAIQPTAPHEKPLAPASLPPAQVPQAAPPRDVAEHNVDQIVTSVRGELLTKGGTMDIRLDPPSLGQVQVQITVEDGVLSANLQTNNDEATRLLSHNLAQLKTQLESAGVSVDRIQVKQATPAEQSSSSNQQNTDGDGRGQSAASQDQSARQEQQRREALQRMWARVAGNGDPLDLVA